MIKQLYNDPSCFIILLTLVYLIALIAVVNLTYKPEVKHYQQVRLSVMEEV